jgi:nucleoside-diphosphate-sugar epimerase
VRSLRDSGNDVREWHRSDGDLANRALVLARLQDDRPDTLFHLAAEGVRSPGLADPHLINRSITIMDNLVDGMAPGTRIVSAGSMTEYGFGGVLSEEMPCMPTTDYNMAKLAAGLHLMGRAKQLGIEVVHARLFHLFGHGEPEHRLFPDLLARLAAGKTIALSDGSQKRDFLHVLDASRWLTKLGCFEFKSVGVEHAVTVNLGTGKALLLRDVIFAIADAMGADRKLLQFGARGRSPADEDILCANTSLLSSLVQSVPPQRIDFPIDLRLLYPYEN